MTASDDRSDAARRLDAVLADIEDAAELARQLITRGREAWEGDRLLQLAGEAVIGRIADAANRLPGDVKQSTPDVPWDDIRGIPTLVDHIYHRIDYDELWVTLERDVPHLLERLTSWRTSRQP